MRGVVISNLLPSFSNWWREISRLWANCSSCRPACRKAAPRGYSREILAHQVSRIVVRKDLFASNQMLRMLMTTVSLMLLIFAAELAAAGQSQSQLTRPQPPQLINAATTRQRYAFIGSWPTQATLLRRMRLGRCTSMAQACRRIFSEALKWFRLAADQGLDGAQYNLGLLLPEHRLPLFVAKAGKIPSV